MRRRHFLIALALTGVELARVLPPAAAATLTVCQTQCGFSTIQGAIDVARPGDTIRIRAGTFRETLRIDKDLIIEGGDSLTTILDGGAQGTAVTVGAGATVAISNLTITNGSGSAGGSANDGGGIHNEGALTLTGVGIRDNLAPENASGKGKGGGIRNDGVLELALCSISENRAVGRGGAVFNTGTLRLNNSTLCGNQSSGGGGIFNEGELTVTGSTIADNDASVDGGGILSEDTSVFINSTLSGNDAGRHGGGLSVRPGTAPVTSTQLIHCTVADNRISTGRGSGIYNESSSSIELRSSIVATNQGARNCFGAVLSRGYNLDGDDSCQLDPRGEAPDQPGTNPLLSQLGHNGGPTLTHALTLDSPAVDAAGDGTCALTTDQRDLPRPEGGRCDIGAYERPSCDPAVPSAEFRRGDADDSADINITDAIFVLGFLFLGTAPLLCEDAGDADDDGRLLVSDPIYLLNWLFKDGPPLPEPIACGPDPTGDDLPCAAARGCEESTGIFRDLWTSVPELESQPTSGGAWDAVWSAAREACPGEATVTNQDANANVQFLAAAIAYARLRDGDPESAGLLRSRVVRALRKLVDEGNPRETHGCPEGCGKAVNSTLAWGREAGAYVLAADLVRYRTPAFEEWVRNLAEVYVACDGRTMLEAFRRRPNNWGVMNFGSLVAMYAYLGDAGRLQEVRDYFAAGLREGIPDCQDALPGEPCYVWGGTLDPEGKDLSWHCDSSSPHLIAPPCTVTVGDGVEIDLGGLIPDDQRRACSFCPPGDDSAICRDSPKEDRCIEPGPDSHISDWMNGAIMGARILDRIGMSIWESGDRAFRRMIVAHMVTHCRLTCDDSGFRCESLYNCKDWVVPILDEAYDLQAQFTPPPPTDCACCLDLRGRGAGAGKNAGFGAYIVR